MEKERQFQLILVSQCKELFYSHVDFAKPCISTVTNLEFQMRRPEKQLLSQQSDLANIGTQTGSLRRHKRFL